MRIRRTNLKGIKIFLQPITGTIVKTLAGVAQRKFKGQHALFTQGSVTQPSTLGSGMSNSQLSWL